MSQTVKDIEQFVALLRRLNESGTLARDSEADLTFHVTREEYDLVEGTDEHIEPDDGDSPGMRYKDAYRSDDFVYVSIVTGDPSVSAINAKG
jgi:hypothetical protein